MWWIITQGQWFENMAVLQLYKKAVLQLYKKDIRERAAAMKKAAACKRRLFFFRKADIHCFSVAAVPYFA